MKLLPYIVSTALAGTVLVGCGQQEQEASSAPATQPATAAPGAHSHADGSTHAAHDESETSHSHGHSHGGEVVFLGEKQVLGFTVKAEQEGAVAAGQEAVFQIETAPASEAVRLWVGDEQATNSVRSRAEGGPTSFHAHTVVPSPLAEEAHLWVEVQNAAGERGSVAFELGGASASGSHTHGADTHSHDHDHADGDHDHTH